MLKHARLRHSPRFNVKVNVEDALRNGVLLTNTYNKMCRLQGRRRDLISKRLSVALLLCFSPVIFAQAQEPLPGPGPGPVPPHAQSPEPGKVPSGVILVKGAWSSASDSVTPLPEGGSITEATYNNPYFGLSFPLPSDWHEEFKGPPPSDSGYYVLAQIKPAATFKGRNKGSILVTAQDMFFALAPASNAAELIKYTRDKLKDDYQVERQPTEVRIANHSFLRFDYVAPVADLHWYILGTEIRCHAVEFIMTSRDTSLLESLIRNMDKIQLPAEADPAAGTGGGGAPVCIKDYATEENVTNRVDAVLTERRFNPIPVRIIIDSNGKVKHIHFISAFPEQSKAITDALLQWTFKPYVRNGQAVEVETGIMFGQSPRSKPPAASPTKTPVGN